MREFRIMRALFALICIAVLICAAAAPGTHFDIAIPALALRIFVVFAVSLLPVVVCRPAVQLLSFLSIDTSRAPPQA